MHSETHHERPLTPLAKAALIASTAAVIVAFYLLALVAAIVLLALLALELVLVLGAARFGLAGWMIRAMEAHVRVVGILFRSFWLRSGGAEYRIALNEGDAPRLFQILDNLCARFAIKRPDKVQLEMSPAAWVHLKGYRAGAGSTRLGLGYDLLCGLTVSEVEAVIAHEMAHAKLVQRGFKRFAMAALNRCGILVGTLRSYIRGAREANADHAVASLLVGPFDTLIRSLARLVAAYSRQDEFEADRGAAEVCGPNSIRSSLLKCDAIAEASNRLSWTERVAQLQTGHGFTEWFGREISAALMEAPSEQRHVFDQYATHPNLPDRLGALPPDIEQELDHSPGVTLLGAPDAIAERLVEEIHRVAAIEEEKDSKAVAKWARRQFRTSAMNWKHVPSLALWTAGVIVVIYGLVEWRNGLVADALGVALIVGGIFAFRFGRYRDARALPIPDYGDLVKFADRKPAIDQQDAMMREFEAKIAAEKRRKRKLDVLLTDTYKNLSDGDFLRAHVGSRVWLRQKKNSVEAHLAHAIAAAELRQVDQSINTLRFVQYHTGFMSPSTAWGAAWAFAAIGEYAGAEALLDKLLRNNPDQKTFLAVSAIARAHRGKTNSAIVAARRACTPSPPSKEYAILLLRLLIDAGLLREASTWLSALAPYAKENISIQFQMLRMQLLKGEFEAADVTAKEFLEMDSATRRVLQVANLYHAARRFATSSEYYFKALAKGHYPEALVALGEIATEQRDKPTARRQLLSALSLKTPAADDAIPATQVFQRALVQLCALEELEHCGAWTAFLPATLAAGRCHEALQRARFVVFAVDEEAAKKHLSAIALCADANYPLSDVVWEKSPKEDQPVRPVRPGVQRAFTVGRAR